MKSKEIIKIVESVLNESDFGTLLKMFISSDRFRPNDNIGYLNDTNPNNSFIVKIKVKDILNYMEKMSPNEQAQLKLEISKVDKGETGRFLRNFAAKHNIKK